MKGKSAIKAGLLMTNHSIDMVQDWTVLQQHWVATQCSKGTVS